MINKNKSIEINYRPDKNNNEKFSRYFIDKNIIKCKIKYEDNKYELAEYFQDIDYGYDNKTPITIKLKGINNIINMRCMFHN